MTDMSHEVALDEFARICEALDLDFDDQDEDDKTKLETLKSAIVKGIENGRITVDESGLPTVVLKYPVGKVAHVAFKEPTAAMLVAFGDTKSKNSTTATWKALEDLTGIPSSTFGKMRKRPDWTLVDTVFALFLA